MDFYRIVGESTKNKTIVVKPSFIVDESEDIIIRGKSFYAIWNEDKALWSTNELDVPRIIDRDLREAAEKYRDGNNVVTVNYAREYGSKTWIEYNNYLKTMPDSKITLDNELTFSNTNVTKKDHASKRLPYPLEKGPYPAWDEIIGTLYEPEEREKLEWSIGSIVTGESKNIQKFIVLYGDAGSGKSTILNIIQMLFQGYYTTFEAKALTSSGNQFSTDAFRSNPLVAIQHDGDLSRIEDNSKLNSIISHEEMMLNEKYKPSYTARINCFLYMATNRPVKITDAKSGILRRLIDVHPSGNRIPEDRYFELMHLVEFELGAIAYHCMEVFNSLGREYYSSYRPQAMQEETDPFYNFMDDNYLSFKNEDGTSLNQAWTMYKEYRESAALSFGMPKYRFKQEIKEYFREYYPSIRINGELINHYYKGIRASKFNRIDPKEIKKEKEIWLKLDKIDSIFEKECADCPAQYATSNEIPQKKWDDVKTTLKDLNTTGKVHYVKVPENHIVIDFDLKDSSGEKSKESNLEAASKWPPTYAEFSKGGSGIHLHYIYDGDPSQLSRLYSENIEIKVFTGKSSLRRKLTFCNDMPITHISSGLPLKERLPVIDFDNVMKEKSIRSLIERNLKKEIHSSTAQSVDFIYHILEEQYKKGAKFDVSDMRPRIMAFANNSTHQAEKCLKLVAKMHFKSDDAEAESAVGLNEDEEDPLVFYDVEVFPNLFLVNYLVDGDGYEVIRMVNPTGKDLEPLFRRKLVGFNCRRYDNHIMYARYLGYSNEELFELSKKIINADKRDDSKRNCFFREAYSLSYTDVYDFASAENKMSLKKWEIELGIHHQELGLPWDQPVPEELWPKVAEYCDNDVISTKAVFYHLKGDWTARQMLAKLAGMTVNDTTNTLTTRIIFGSDRNPQLVYTDLATGQQDVPGYESKFINYFPGYEYVDGKNMFRGEDVGRGGYVWAVPGIYYNAVTFDVRGMHPHSIIAMNYFGEYTKRFEELVTARDYIKHKDYDTVSKMLEGLLIPYLTDPSDAKAVSSALKTANNSCYGLSSASFPNAMRHPKNVNNIVALRGALFMVTLRDEIVARGGKPFHIKTDSIKLENPSKELTDFIFDFGKKYGYDFEIEHKFEKICLVNNAVYVARLSNDDPDDPGTWTATGAEFQHPYIFKTLFSHEPIEFKDMCETKEVKNDYNIYLDFNEDLDDPTELEVQLEKLEKKFGPDHPALIELRARIAECHNYKFVGRVGSFCPMRPGANGGWLVKTKGEKYGMVTGATGYRWLEAEVVKELGKQDEIDFGYFRSLVDDAIGHISEFGDAEAFISDDSQSKEPSVLPWCDKDDCNSCVDRKDCHDLAASFVTNI